jgi:hypothetical protein
MNSTKPLLVDLSVLQILFLGLFFNGLPVSGQDIQHLTTTVPGGIPGIPIVTGVEQLTSGLRVTWDGPPGYYQLFEKQRLNDPIWAPVGGRTNLARRATISSIHSNAFFQVAGPSPQYGGSQMCSECHENTHNSAMETRHGRAFETLRLVGQDKNASCLPCHTVGFSMPTGFTSEIKTPHLAGVQCESCHGPAGNHASNENDPAVRPRVELASQVCGGCHNGSHHATPTFEQWKRSGHAQVVEDMNPLNRIESCGRCHSGTARMSLLKGDPHPVGDANVGIVCTTCHNPHAKTGNPAQLRNPLVSTNDFFLSTTDNFASKYNPNINICAQCHNHRGAAWTSSNRPPHHSPQYNILLGTIGELKSGSAPHRARHATLEKQCVSCHMPTEEPGGVEPSFTHHTFRVESFDSCRSCHPLPEMLAEFTSFAISSQIQELNSTLNLWATSKAPVSLREKYGVRAWEYTSPGELSAGGPGPTSAEQALIPENIKKARFNIYLVLNDGSFGVHNGPYSIALLGAARDWVREELSK